MRNHPAIFACFISCLLTLPGYAQTELLIANGVNVNVKDIDGRLPLHAAAGSNASAVTYLLIAKGAKVDEKDRCLSPIGARSRGDYWS